MCYVDILGELWVTRVRAKGDGVGRGVCIDTWGEKFGQGLCAFFEISSSD